MERCIFCPNELTKDNKPEHILLNALGGAQNHDTRRLLGVQRQIRKHDRR